MIDSKSNQILTLFNDLPVFTSIYLLAKTMLGVWVKLDVGQRYITLCVCCGVAKVG